MILIVGFILIIASIIFDFLSNKCVLFDTISTLCLAIGLLFFIIDLIGKIF